MKPSIISKGLAVVVIILFIGLAIQPSLATVQTETKIDVKPKDYLFQTIIEIANNPDAKELLEQYSYNLFEVYIDRSVYHKIFFRNPRLLFQLIVTKPPITYEYLEKCFNNGIEITNIIGEDKVLDIIENIKITDTRIFNELNNLISKDEELSSRLDTLKMMNEETNTDIFDTPIICLILFVIFFIGGTGIGFLEGIYSDQKIFGLLFLPVLLPIYVVSVTLVVVSFMGIFGYFECLDFPDVPDK